MIRDRNQVYSQADRAQVSSAKRRRRKVDRIHPPRDMLPNALRLIRFERCLALFVAAHHEPDRLILAPEAVVTTAAAQSCADRESLKCQSHDAEGQRRPPGKAMTFPLPDQQQPLH